MTNPRPKIGFFGKIKELFNTVAKALTKRADAPQLQRRKKRGEGSVGTQGTRYQVPSRGRYQSVRDTLPTSNCTDMLWGQMFWGHAFDEHLVADRPEHSDAGSDFAPGL